MPWTILLFPYDSSLSYSHYTVFLPFLALLLLLTETSSSHLSSFSGSSPCRCSSELRLSVRVQMYQAVIYLSNFFNKAIPRRSQASPILPFIISLNFAAPIFGPFTLSICVGVGAPLIYADIFPLESGGRESQTASRSSSYRS
jgi:hypothetical protein